MESLAPPRSSGSSSRSSRHSKRGSIQSVDLGSDFETGNGLATSAGVITSIPFESLPADKTPIPVDTVSRQEVRIEPAPNHIAKIGNDFHQYPAWNPPKQNGSYSSVPPRPPPHSSNVSIAGSSSGNKSNRYPQWPGRSDSFGVNGGGFGHPSSTSTLDSSSNSRTSLDQASVYSSMSSNTRGSSNNSHSDGSSRTLTTSASTDRAAHYPISSMNRLSSASSIVAPTIPADYLAPPGDDRMVDFLFLELMKKRGWQNLPEQARRQMIAYPAAKKWTLVHQDRLTELQSAERRRQNARHTQGSDYYIARADEEGSPEWYVKKVMDDSLTSKQLGSLSVSLRTQPIR